jgi:hypothetical protein
MSSIDHSGTFMLGDRTVKRIGYGAMQLAGPGVRKISAYMSADGVHAT